jgi:hypothetical protein
MADSTGLGALGTVPVTTDPINSYVRPVDSFKIDRNEPAFPLNPSPQRPGRQWQSDAISR